MAHFSPLSLACSYAYHLSFCLTCQYRFCNRGARVSSSVVPWGRTGGDGGAWTVEIVLPLAL